MPKLEPLCTFRASLGSPQDVGATPGGLRRIFPIQEGVVQGPRLSGRLSSGGGDWLLVGSDGVGRLDVRGTLETDDGALVYVQYHGVLVFNEKVLAAMGAGTETGFGDTYFMIAPRFETGDAGLAWLNSVVAVGEGRVLPSAVEYRLFTVEND